LPSNPLIEQAYNSPCLAIFISATFTWGRKYPRWVPLFACGGVGASPLEEVLDFSALVLFLVEDFFDVPETVLG